MNDGADAFHLFMKHELDRSCQMPADLPVEMLALIDQICPQG